MQRFLVITLEVESHQSDCSLYNKFGRTYLFDLDFWFLKLDENGVEQEDCKVKYCIDAYHAGNVSTRIPGQAAQC